MWGRGQAGLWGAQLQGGAQAHPVPTLPVPLIPESHKWKLRPSPAWRVRLLLLGATKTDRKDPERAEPSLAAPVIQDAVRKQV